MSDLGALSVAVGLPEDGPASLMGEDGSISVTVTFESSPTDDQLAAVAAIGSVTQVYTIAPAILVSVEPGRVGELAPVPGVVAVQPVLEPSKATAQEVGASLSTQLTVSPAALPKASCRSIPVEADGPQLSAEARELFDVDGSGVTVGIISDSYAALAAPTSPAEDVAAGLLPGPGNPCGYEQPVEVLRDIVGDDEGRAMAQLVHGIAPGAKLMFATGFTGGSIGMAQAVQDLADAGADIIVDDLGIGDELVFQYGVLSTVISSVRASGVAYYSAAGNGTTIGAEGTPSAGVPLNGWLTPEFRTMQCPAWITSYKNTTSYDCLDWSPVGAGEASDTFGYNAQGQLHFTFQWGEPAYGVTSQFEGQIYRKNSTDRTLVSVGFGRDDTMPIVDLGLSPEHGAGDYELVLIRDTSTPDTKPAVSVGIFGNARPLTWRQHDRSVGGDIAGFSAYGHAGDGSAVSVAASDWLTPNLPEDFSSLGPNLLLFEPVELGASTPAARLPEPELVSSPRITAVDGTQTSFFSSPSVVDGTTQYRFFGTSAAAPNAAAVHALAAEFAPKAPAETIVQEMYATAADMTNPYGTAAPDAWVFGAGLVNASALLEALDTSTPEPTPEPTPQPTVEPTPDPTPLPTLPPTSAGGAAPASGSSAGNLAATGYSVPAGLLVFGALALLAGSGVLIARRRVS